MQIKLVSSSLVAQSFIVVAACVAAPLFCASRASADTSGFVTAWGNNDYDQCNIPAAAATSGVSAIASACNAAHTIALKDGAVLAWGYNDYGQCTIPNSFIRGVYAIAGGGYHTIALNRDIPSYQAEIAALSSQNTALTAQLNCGDLNGDGEVNGADLGRMLISWGQCQ
jgi:alpha-tubulin suppressor-like RCC1 family protein